jgi:hypothetical protein
MRRRTFLSSSAMAGLSLRGSGAATVAAGDIPKRVFGKTGGKLTIIGQAGGRFPMCGYEDAKAITRGPRLENWKRDVNKQASAPRYCDGAFA